MCRRELGLTYPPVTVDQTGWLVDCVRIVWHTSSVEVHVGVADHE